MSTLTTWCFSTLGCVEAGLAEVVALADLHAIPLLELRGLDGSLDLAAALAAAWCGHRDLCLGLREARRVRVLGTSFLLLRDDAAGRDQLLACAAQADALDCPWLRVFGRAGGGLDLADAELERAGATLAWWRGERAARGLRCDLLLETHDVFSSTANCRRLLLIDGGVDLLWDAHHTWAAAGEPFAATWAALGARVRHVHVKDSRLHQGRREGALPGAGEVPIPALLALLREADYAGAVSLEWERHWEPHLPPLADALAALAPAGWRALS